MELQKHFQLLEEEFVGQDAEETPQEDISRAAAQQNTVPENYTLQKEEESSCSRGLLTMWDWEWNMMGGSMD